MQNDTWQWQLDTTTTFHLQSLMDFQCLSLLSIPAEQCLNLSLFAKDQNWNYWLQLIWRSLKIFWNVYLFIWGKKNNLNVLFIKAPGTAIRKRVSWNCAFRNVLYADSQQTLVCNTAQGSENSREAELLDPILPLPLSGSASSGKQPNYSRPPFPYLQNKGNELAYRQEVFWL